MSNVLLVEPDYRSKFPPLGLMRLAAYHRAKGDAVTFVRGKSEEYRACDWHRVYVASLFTYELPRTVDTARYYAQCVSSPGELVVGGIGATLMPEYVLKGVDCRVIQGPLDRAGILDDEAVAVADLTPDYSLLSSVNYDYKPEDAYFLRTTRGCIRKCGFCAVPVLEPLFETCTDIAQQIQSVDDRYGEKQHLVLLDNNVLAASDLAATVRAIRTAGFEAGARRNNRQRTVDFNQGIDARLVTAEAAKLLSSVCLSPVRLAFDFDGMERSYRRAVHLLAENGFIEFTNYVMYNYKDTPQSFYYRLSVGVELSRSLGIRLTGFPMRFVPISDITRRYVSAGWHWKYLRGIQCILNATHGLVSPNPSFFAAAFGKDVNEFLEIVSMPDRYIIERNRYKDPSVLQGQDLDLLHRVVFDVVRHHHRLFLSGHRRDQGIGGGKGRALAGKRIPPTPCLFGSVPALPPEPQGVDELLPALLLVR